jgi:hypothetical protein
MYHNVVMGKQRVSQFHLAGIPFLREKRGIIPGFQKIIGGLSLRMGNEDFPGRL